MALLEARPRNLCIAHPWAYLSVTSSTSHRPTCFVSHRPCTNGTQDVLLESRSLQVWLSLQGQVRQAVRQMEPAHRGVEESRKERHGRAEPVPSVARESAGYPRDNTKGHCV